MSVKVGEKVLLPEYGGTKVTMEEKVSVVNNLAAVMCFMLVEKVHSWHDFVGWEFTKPCCYYQTTQYLETRKKF